MPVNEAVCPRWSESLEDSQIFKQGDLQKLQENDKKFKELEEYLKKKTVEIDSMIKIIHEKDKNELYFKQELNKQSHIIMQLEKDKFNMNNEIKKVQTEKMNFIEQFKLLQHDFIKFKQNVPSEKLMIDAYIQTGIKQISECVQTESFSPPIPKPKEVSSMSKYKSTTNSSKGMSRKYSK